MSNKYPSASHLLTLVDHLEAGHALTVARIREMTGVKRATAQKYLGWLRRHRNLDDRSTPKGKVWRLAGRGGRGDVDGAAALQFAVEALRELDGTDHLDQLALRAEDARAAVADGLVGKLDRLTRTFQVQGAEKPTHHLRAEFVRDLLDAVRDRLVCDVTYMRRRDGKTQSYELEPWGMVLYRGRLLLLAGKRTGKRRPDRRFFELDGFREVEKSDERFPEPPPHATDFGAMFQDSFGIYTDWKDPAEDVVLEVDGPPAVALAQRLVHPSQQNDKLDDGRLRVRLRVFLCPDFRSFILGLVPHVRIVEPDHLREDLLAAVSNWKG